MSAEQVDSQDILSRLERPVRADQLLEAARAIDPIVRAGADAADGLRCLTEDVVHAMQEAGAFRMTMPRSLGGIEADPVTQLKVVEAISIADSSAGWVAMIGSDGGYLAGNVGDELAAELYPDIDVLTAVVAAPSVKAERVEGGVRLSGEWRFASCCRHATWIGGGCLLTEGGAPIIEDGRPLMVKAFVPMKDVEILDTWSTTGLAGTGSNDIAVHDVFVPERYVIPAGQASKNPSPLYRYPMMLMCNVSGVPLGVARRAIDELCAIACDKIQMPAMKPMSKDPFVQGRIGRAETQLASARALMIETVAEIWEVLVAGEPLPLDLRSRFRMANLHCFHVAREVVAWMYDAGGSSSLYRPHPLERAMRDVSVMATHLLVKEAGYAEVGRVSLGLDPESFIIES
jgi:alkylation response protein AidB-like acyl-CoA dehydrogenase